MSVSTLAQAMHATSIAGGTNNATNTSVRSATSSSSSSLVQAMQANTALVIARDARRGDRIALVDWLVAVRLFVCFIDMFLRNPFRGDE